MVTDLRPLLVAALFSVGCTSTRAVPPGNLYGSGRLDGVYILSTRDGRSVMSDRIVAADSAFVLSAVLVDAKRTVIPPTSISYAEITSVARRQTDVLATVLVTSSIVAVVWSVGWFLGNMGPIGK